MLMGVGFIVCRENPVNPKRCNSEIIVKLWGKSHVKSWKQRLNYIFSITKFFYNCTVRADWSSMKKYNHE